MHLKTACRLLINCSGRFSVMPISSTHRAHWYVLLTGSKESRIRLEKADSDLLRPFASLRSAKVLLAKLNASISTDRWSAICKQCYAWEQPRLIFCRKRFLSAICCAASVGVLTKWLFFCSHLTSGCSFFLNLRGDAICCLVSLVWKWNLRFCWPIEW